jgi:hypothetical protein
MLDLFADTPPWQEPLAPGAIILRRYARERAPALLQAISEIASRSPFRQMVTPGGYTMSVAMTNCGELGWTTNQHGYLYAADDPLTGKRWPQMPPLFRELAAEAAAAAAMRALPRMRVLSTAISRERSCRCIRIKTSKTCERRLSPSRWGCRQYFSSAGCGVTIRYSGCCWSTATWWSGAANRGCFTTVFSR